MPETPATDDTARVIAERVYAAYARQAVGAGHPQQEQSLLTRLAEAALPPVRDGSDADTLRAVNAVLDAWEQADGQIRGPRIGAIDLGQRSVRLASS